MGEHVKTFRKFLAALPNKDLKRAIFKIPAPVLTRWWTVGEAARVVWTAYLLIFRISQQVINANTSAKATKIASGLQPLMMELEIFSDLSLINNFHSFYVSPHFDWMQSSTDLTATPGFQAHNTLVCYFLMVEDLTALSTAISTTHPSFHCFQATLAVCTPELRQGQEAKASEFVSIALASVNKHFERWCKEPLLPAALLSEGPMAAVVASVIL